MEKKIKPTSSSSSVMHPSGPAVSFKWPASEDISLVPW